MVPEMGIHLLLSEPPFLWKQPLSGFKLYNESGCLCADSVSAVYLCEDVSRCERVVYFHYVAAQCKRERADVMAVRRQCLCVR